MCFFRVFGVCVTWVCIARGRFSNRIFRNFFLLLLFLLTIHNDQISYVKHVLDSFFCVFHPIWVFGRGQGAGAPPVDAAFHPLQLKMEISENNFSDIVTIHNDQISYLKHV